MDIQHIVVPEAGKDYPRNWNAFLDWFGSEEACLAYLERLRWPQEFVCPACGVSQPPYRSSRGRLMCRACGRQSTVTSCRSFCGTSTVIGVRSSTTAPGWGVIIDGVGDTLSAPRACTAR